MKKYFILAVLIVILGFSAKVSAEENMEMQVEAISDGQVEEMLDEDAEDDIEVDISQLNIGLSKEEQLQENSTSVDFIANVDKIEDLPCNDTKLLEQVQNFIHQKISEKDASSFVEKRERVLMVRNLNNFEEINQNEIGKKDGFKAQAALMNLRINQNKEILHICSSLGNKYNKFQRIYLIIYPFANFYKVVVANLIENVDDIEQATFVYNW